MENENKLAFIIASASLCMFMLMTAGVIFMFFYKRKMSFTLNRIQQLEEEKKLLIFKSASEAQEKERERIARNLHDEINLMLAVHKQVLEKHAFNFESNEFDINDYNREIENIEKIREAVTACATDLVPAFLLKNGFLITIEDYMRQLNNVGKLKARCNVLLKERISNYFGKQEELNIYRICLELINNLLKHAHPKELTVTVSNENTSLLVQIDHDGKKSSNEEINRFMEISKGLGLNSIKARCLILKANINYIDNHTGPAIQLLVPASKSA